MTAGPSIDPARFLHEELAQASPDLMRELLGTFINALLSAQADSVCGAEYGTRSEERTNRRNGYRHRDLDTRAGTVDVAIPKLREGTYFPDWLLTRHRRAEAALTTVVATCYLLGVSTRRMDKLVRDLGDHRAVQVAGVGDGQGPRRAGRGVSDPPVGRGPVHVRGRGRVDDEGPRGRPGGQGRGHGRHRRQRRGLPRGPRDQHRDSRVRRRLVGVLPGPGRPRPDRGRAGHLRCARRAGRRDRCHVPGRVLAAVPHPLRREPDVDHPQVPVGLGQGAAAQRVRPTRRRRGARPVRPGPGRPARQAACRRASTSRPPARTSWPSPSSRRRSGVRSGPTTPTNDSTARSAAAPTSSGSSPTATRSSASSGPSWPSNTTSGPSNAATSASRPSRTPEPS